MNSPNSIPTLSPHHNLAYGRIIECDMTKLYWNTVSSFPESSTRPDLFAGLETLRDGIGFVPWEQWISGKFVSTEINPDTLHCINLCHKEHWEGMPNSSQEQFKDAMLTWCNREITQDICGCHSSFAILVPNNHPKYQQAMSIIKAWTRRYSERPRWGSFSVPIDENPSIDDEATA